MNKSKTVINLLLPMSLVITVKPILENLVCNLPVLYKTFWNLIINNFLKELGMYL